VARIGWCNAFAIALDLRLVGYKLKRLAYIDALRGYAILMVIVVHSSQYFSDLPLSLNFIADQGARGVQLFFVVSALTLSMSWYDRHDGTAAFFIRRLFRIAPMFWLAVIFFVAAQGLGPRYFAPDGIGFKHVIVTILFMHGLLPDTITSVVPGGWSIAVEMMFYTIFPLLMFQITSTRRTIVALVACLILDVALHALIVHLANEQSGAWHDVYLSFGQLYLVHQMPCFLIGIGAFHLARKRPRLILDHPIISGAIAILPMVGILLVRLALDIRGAEFGSVFAVAWVFAFSALLLQSKPQKVVVNPVVCWIGKVSFSAYLVHFALMVIFPTPPNWFSSSTQNYCVVFLLLTSTTTALSTISYLLIEVPMIKFGNKLARVVSLRSRNEAVNAATLP
jgi:peptidoglycan/LPS O-acetylase OafA/YrhL